MAAERFYLELDPPQQVQADWPHVVIVGGGLAGLRGWQVTGLMGWILWALAHLAFIPDTENRTALLITGRSDQHLGVDVGLTRAEPGRSDGSAWKTREAPPGSSR